MIKVWNNLYILLYLLSKKVGYILVGSIYNKTGINMKGYIKKLLRESLIREELSDKEMNNLKRLIDSGQGDNIEMAFMIASGHGEDVENALFTYWYNSMNGSNLTWDELKNLKKLGLYKTQLTSLPDSIGKLTNLKKLTLYKTQLTSLPDSIGNLTNLDELVFWRSQLKSLPDWIGNLTNLEWLYLDDNNLTTLPEGIGNLTNLEWLGLSDNPISDKEKERIKELLPNTDIRF